MLLNTTIIAFMYILYFHVYFVFISTLCGGSINQSINQSIELTDKSEMHVISHFLRKLVKISHVQHNSKKISNY